MSQLREKASKAVIWDFIGSYGSQITYFIISIFLARLLSPADFGLVGMAMVFISLLNVFKDFGFSSALVQNTENSSITYSSIFFINILAGAILTLIIILVAPLIGNFYNNPKITDIVRLLSLTFFISSFNIVQGTILRIKLDFKSITIRGLTSQFIGGVIGVLAAFYDYGVYSLVIQQISASIINTILLWKITSWYPKFEFSLVEVKKLFGFSAFVFFGQFVNQLFKQLDTLVVGKMFSASTLGFYSRAESINSLISKNSVTTFNKVFFPVLSSIKNEDERFEKVYFKVIDLIGSLSVFLTCVFFLCGRELILTLFGEKWEPSVLIFQVLIIKGFSYPLSVMMVSALHAKGKSKEDFLFGLIKKLLQLSPLVFAYFSGFQAFLYALVTVNILSWLLNSFFVHKVIDISFLNQVLPVFKMIFVSIVFIFLIFLLFGENEGKLIAASKVFIFSTLFFSYCFLFKKDLVEEVKVYAQIPLKFIRKK